MARPQQPELARSAKTDLDPDHVETGLQGQPTPKSGGETGPVPLDNQAGHHPEKEQDKPDLDAFAARLGTDPKAPTATRARKPPRPGATGAKAAPARSTQRKAAPAAAKPSSRPAGTAIRGPAAPPTVATTPANRPASAPGWPESTPAAGGDARDMAGISAPQPPPEPAAEPRLVGLVLLPLRETVKRLEQLDRTLSERLAGARQAARGGIGPKNR